MPAVVVGYVIRFPLGAMTLTFLNYLLGLRSLGFEPVFMEPAWPYQPCCYDVARREVVEDPSYGIAYWQTLLAARGLEGLRWWYRDDDLGDRGMSREAAISTLEESAVLLNVGASGWAPEFGRAPRRVLVDCDAPFTQIRLASGDEYWATFIDSHDFLATTAVNLADGSAPIPDAGRSWHPTRPPVHVPSFEVSPVPQGPWTTVTSWNSDRAALWNLEEFREKDAEYVRLKELPALLPDQRLELALGGEAPRSQLLDRGWRLVDSEDVTGTPQRFCEYIAGSRGELAVAKQAFVRGRTGAANDRSLGYLASGRPVVCSETGLDWLPHGEGLLTFEDAESAAAAVREVEADPQLHGDAARRLAEEHFSADRVLADLLDAADVQVPAGSSGSRLRS